MTLSGDKFQLHAGEQSAEIVSVGAGLRRYTYASGAVVRSYPEDELPPKGSGAALVPFPGRIRDGKYIFEGQTQQLALTEPATGNAIHGLGRWARWECIGYHDSEVTLALDIVPTYGYPYEVHVEVNYSLHPKKGLTCYTSATNKGATNAPFGVGFHPYVALGGLALEDATVTVPASRRLIVDDKGIPVSSEAVVDSEYDLRGGKLLGSLRLNDAYTDLVRGEDGRAVAEITHDDGGARVWVDSSYNYLQLFTVDSLSGGWPGIAVEPMSCPPDAFNSGTALTVLEPGQTWSGSWGITAF